MPHPAPAARQKVQREARLAQVFPGVTPLDLKRV